MKKLFSLPVYAVLSISCSLIIIFSHEAEDILRVFGGASTIMVMVYSSFVFLPLIEFKEDTKLWVKFLLAGVYLLMLAGGIVTTVAIYYQMYDPATLANLQVVFFPGASAAIIGIIFWIGIARAVPPSERRDYHKEYEDMKKQVDAFERSSCLN